MSDNQQQAQSQADESETTETDETRPDAAPAQAAEPTEVKDLPSWAQKEIRDLRREAAAQRTKAQQFEDRDKSDLQKAQDAAKRFEDAAKEGDVKLRALQTEQAVRDAAAAAGARNPKLIYRAVKDDLEFDGDGTITNLDAVLKDAKKTAPELFGAASGKADGGQGGSDRNEPSSMNALLRQKAGYSR